MEELLELSDEELRGPCAAELEDAVQRGLAAVHVGELWVSHLRRELEGVRRDPARVAALEREIAESRASIEDVRRQVAPLHDRANALGVGTVAR